jgi:hypothetical protein
VIISSTTGLGVQAHDGMALIGFGLCKPAYISVCHSITEQEARDFAVALINVADQLAQQATDNARLAGIAEQTKEADERAAARVDRMNRSKTFHGVSVAGQIAGLRA